MSWSEYPIWFPLSASQYSPDEPQKPVAPQQWRQMPAPGTSSPQRPPSGIRPEQSTGGGGDGGRQSSLGTMHWHWT